jgi:WD40 repeat protein
MRYVLLAVCLCAVTASADDGSIKIRKGSYAAVAYSPSTGKYHYAHNHNTRKGAEDAAKAGLGTDDAKNVGWVNEGFFALALGDDKTAYGTGYRFGAGANNIDAAKDALKNCNDRTKNARIVVCLSSDGQYVFEPELKKDKKDAAKAEPKKDSPSINDLLADIPKLAIGDLVNVTWMGKTYLARVTGKGLVGGLWPDVKFTVDGKEIEVSTLLCEKVSKAMVLNPDPSAVLAPNPMPKPAEAMRPPKLAVGDEVEVRILGEKLTGRLVEINELTGFARVDIPVAGVSSIMGVRLADVSKKGARDPDPQAAPKAAEALKPLPPGTFVRAVLKETDPKAALGAIAFRDDGRVIAVDWGDNTIRLHAVDDGTATNTRVERKEFPVRGKPVPNGALVGMAFTQKGTALTIVCEKTVQTVYIGGGPDALLSQDLSLSSVAKHTAFAVSPDKGTVAVAADDLIFFYDPASKGPPARSTWVGLRQIKSGVDAMAYSPDGKRLAINGVGTDKVAGRQLQFRAVELWDVPGHKFLGSPPTNVDGERFVAFSPDGKSLVTGRGIRDVTAADGKNWRELKTATVPTAVAYDPKGKWVATAGADRRLVLTDAATGEKLATVRAADRRITNLAVSPDGATIATSGSYKPSEDSEATLWDVAALLKAAPKEESITKLAATPLALTAFDFGIDWAEGMLNSRNKDAPRTPNKDVAALAKTLGVAVPDSPPAGGTLGEFMKQLSVQGAGLGGELRKKHGATQERLFTLGLQMSLIAKLYRPDAAAQKLPTVEGIRRAAEKFCRDLELPDATHRRLSARIAANDPADAVVSEVVQLVAEVRGILSVEPRAKK